MQNSQDPKSMFQKVFNLFEWFPLAAMVENRVLCVHGGLGRNVTSVQDLTKIEKPIKLNFKDVANDANQ